MAAEVLSNESGQSLVEFMIVLPLLLGLVVIMTRINQIIQVSIVNQQYARHQALVLARNYSIYPKIPLRESELTAKGYNQMVIGVSDNVAPDDDPRYTPKATVGRITRARVPASDEGKSEPKQRANVRVRNTVTLCTQNNVLIDGGNKPILPPGAPSNLNEKSKFDICGSPMKYE